MKCLRVSMAILLLLVAFPPSRGLAASPIVLDGQFGDWLGKARLEDGYGDTKHHWDDVRYWYWATNDGQSAIFFMVQRYPRHGEGEDLEETGGEIDVQMPFFPGVGLPGGGSSPYPELEDLMQEFDSGKGNDKAKKEAHYTIFVDADNNGQFGDVGDAVIYADYYPKYLGYTGVSVFVRTGSTWARSTYGGFWGENEADGGSRCEFPVPFSNLSIEPGQSLRLILFAQDKRTDPLIPDPISAYEHLVDRREADRVPDQGDLQWAPVSTLGRFGWLLLIAAGAVMPVVAKRRQSSPGGNDR